MNELEKAAREYCKDVRQSTGRDSDPANAFQSGAQWHSKQSPWISVEERLPAFEKDNPKRYLVKVESGSASKEYRKTIGWLRSRDKWNVEMDWVTVTHWMEIPE